MNTYDALAPSDLVKQKMMADEEAQAFLAAFGQPPEPQQGLGLVSSNDEANINNLLGMNTPEPQPSPAGALPVPQASEPEQVLGLKDTTGLDPLKPNAGLMTQAARGMDILGKNAGEFIGEKLGTMSDRDYGLFRAKRFSEMSPEARAKLDENNELSNMEVLKRSLSGGTEGVIANAPADVAQTAATFSPYAPLRYLAPVIGGGVNAIQEYSRGQDLLGGGSSTAGQVAGFMLAKKYAPIVADTPWGQAAASYGINLLTNAATGLFRSTGKADVDAMDSLDKRIKENWEEFSRAESLGALAAGQVLGAGFSKAYEGGLEKAGLIESAQDRAAREFPKADSTLRDSLLDAAGYMKDKDFGTLSKNTEVIDRIVLETQPAFLEYSKALEEAKKNKTGVDQLAEYEYKKATADAVERVKGVLGGYGDSKATTDSMFKRFRDKTFSLDATERLDFERIFKLQDEAIKNGEVLSAKEAVKRLTGSEDSKLAKFIDSIRTDEKDVIFYRGDKSQVGLGSYDPDAPVKVAVNFDGENVQKSFGTLAHELSHDAFLMAVDNAPEIAKPVVDTISQTTYDERLKVFKALSDATGIRDINIEYQAGKGYEQDVPRVASETLAGAVEFIARDAMKNKDASTTAKLIALLPASWRMPVMKLLTKVNKALFSKDGFGRMYDERTMKIATDVFDFINKAVVDSSHAVETGMKLIERIHSLEPEAVGARLSAGEAPFDMKRVASIEGTEPVSKLYKELGSYTKGSKPNSVYVKLFGNMLELKNRFPETTPIVNDMLYFAGRVGADVENVINAAWSNNPNDSRSKTARDFNADMRYLTSNPHATERMGRAVMKDQEARNKKDFKVSDLLTDGQMKAEGLSEKEISIVRKLYKLTETVARIDVEKMLERNTYEYAKAIREHVMKVDKTFTKEQALAMAQTLTQPANEMAMAKLKVKKAQADLKALLPDTPERAAAQKKVEELKRRQQIVEQAGYKIVQDTVKNLPDGLKFSAPLFEIVKVLGYDAAAQGYNTHQQGYMPMTRRGNYIAFATNGLDYVTFDHNDEKKVDKKAQELRAQGYSVEVLNKEQARVNYKNVGVESVRRLVMERAANVDEAIANLKNTFGDDPKMTESLEFIKKSIHSVDSDMKAISAIRGDANMKERNMVKGFNTADFVPNSLDYARFKTYRTERELLNAKAAFNMTDEFYAKQPVAREDIIANLKYMSNGSISDWKTFRQFAGAMFLAGGTGRWIVNAFQPVTSGAPVVLDRLLTAGLNEVNATKVLTRGLARAAEYGKNGKFDNPVENSMVAKAKAEGAFGARALESFSPTDEIFGSASDTLHSFAIDGDKTFANTVKGTAKTFLNDVMKTLQKFDALSENANRQTSFIVGIELAKELGYKNPKDIYEFALSYNMDVNYSGDKSNRVGLSKQAQDSSFWHGLSLSSMSMKSFIVNQINVLKNMAFTQDGTRYNYATGERTEKVSRRAVAYAMGIQLMVAGSAGILGKKELESALESLGIETDLGFAEWLHENFGQVAYDTWTKGVLSPLFGMDISRKASSEMVNIDPKEDIAANLANTVAGAPFGAASQALKGAKYLISGEGDLMDRFSTAGKKYGPVAVQELLRAGDMYKRGGMPVDAYGKPISERELTETEKASWLAGTGAKPVTEHKENVRKKIDTERKFTETRRGVEDAVAKAFYEGDAKKAARIKGDFDELRKKKGWGDDTDTQVGFANAVAKNILDYQSAKAPTASAVSYQAVSSLRKLTGQLAPEYRSEVLQELVSLQVCLRFGLTHAAVQKLNSLPDTLINKALVDTLVKTGAPPHEVKKMLELYR